jgi:hypothetical protein
MRVAFPPKKNTSIIEYCVSDLVSDVVQSAVKMINAKTSGKYSFYHKRYGYWFEDQRLFLGYNLKEEVGCKFCWDLTCTKFTHLGHN